MNSHKKHFQAFIYLQVLVLIVSLFFYNYDLKLAGAFSGKFSIWVFWIVAIPGILQRFRVKNKLQKIQLFLMKYRRYLGIIVFNFAFIHFMWMRGLDIIATGLPSSIPLYQVFGAIALVLLTPLFLTSNNYSVKKLGKFWKTLHTEKSRNKRTTLEFGRFRGKFRRFRDKMKEVNRSFKVKISTRTGVNKELNLSDIRMRNRLWIYVSREEETNKPIGIFN